MFRKEIHWYLSKWGAIGQRLQIFIYKLNKIECTPRVEMNTPI